MISLLDPANDEFSRRRLLRHFPQSPLCANRCLLFHNSTFFGLPIGCFRPFSGRSLLLRKTPAHAPLQPSTRTLWIAMGWRPSPLIGVRDDQLDATQTTPRERIVSPSARGCWESLRFLILRKSRFVHDLVSFIASRFPHCVGIPYS